MLNRHRQLFRCAALVVVSALTACGGGGGGSSANAPVVVQTAMPAPTATPVPVATSTPSSCTSGSGYHRRVAKLAVTNWVNPNRLYVGYRASAAARVSQSVDRVVNAANVHDFGVANGVGHRVITLPLGANVATATAALRASSDVVSVDAVHYRIPATIASPGTDAVNDPFSADDNANNIAAMQWYTYITNVNPGAWNISHGSSSVSVAIIDTGVDLTNPDLPVTYSESDVGGVTTVSTPSNLAAEDTNDHGTNVAGLATATANNGQGYAGYGYGVSLQAYRIFPQATSTNDCQQADTTDEAQAIDDAVANGASVINLSLGSPAAQGADAAEQAAVEAAITAGVTVVAANGNENGTSSDYPAAYAGVIAVGASAVADDNVGATYGAITAETIASYSNSGPTLVAPGGDATNNNDPDGLHWIAGYSSTQAADPVDQCKQAYPNCDALFNGTSQATPQVAGTIALMEAYHGGSRSLSPAQVLAILSANSDPLPGIAANREGAGRLDAMKAVMAAHP